MTQWILAVAAFAVGLLLHRRPVLNLVAQAALLAVADLPGRRHHDQPGGRQLGAARADHAGRPIPHHLAGRRAAGRGRPDRLDRRPVRPGGLRRRRAGRWRSACRCCSAWSSAPTGSSAGRPRSGRRRSSAGTSRRAGRRAPTNAAPSPASCTTWSPTTWRRWCCGSAWPGTCCTDLDPRVGEVFDDVHGTGTAALADLRRLVAVLRDPDGVRGDAALTAIDPAALPAALGAAVDRARQAGVIVEADIDPAVGALDAVRGPGGAATDPGGADQRGQARRPGRAGPPDGRRRRRRRALGGHRRRRGGPGWPHGVARRRVPAAAGTASTGMRERVEVLGGRSRRARPDRVAGAHRPAGGGHAPARPLAVGAPPHAPTVPAARAGRRTRGSRRDPGAAGRRPAPRSGPACACCATPSPTSRWSARPTTAGTRSPSPRGSSPTSS